MVRGEPGPVLTRRAGVVGSPIAHSLSPVLHRAAYAALGLDGWTYERTEVPRGGLAQHLAGLDERWAGLSVTMPGKEEALALADGADELAVLAGAANTLIPRGGGWYAVNTDVVGLATALVEAGATRPGRAVVVGGGATARSALLALRQLGTDEVQLLVRDDVRPQTRDLLDRLDLVSSVRSLADGIPLDAGEADVVIGTLPGSAPAPAIRPGGGAAPVLLDVSYAPWPSSLAAAVARATGDRVTVVRGTGMLLHQAARQVELMTGREAPVSAMAAALTARIDRDAS